MMFRCWALHCIVLWNFVVGEDILNCHVGFGSKSTQVIPPERINDGYCDCPADGGIDELETDACSGSNLWAGNNHKQQQSDEESLYQCPQQKDLFLALSRLYDGICDCCDGADEKDGDCVDICDVVLSEERAAKEKRRIVFEKGSKRRQIDVEQFQILKESTEKEIDRQKEQIPPLQESIRSLEGQIKDTKLSYSLNYLLPNRVKVFGHLKLPVATLNQLFTFISSVCQMSGEIIMAETTFMDKETCVPLRRAGLDLGILWKNENLETETVTVRHAETDEQIALEIVDILYANYVSENSLKILEKETEDFKSKQQRQTNHRSRHHHEYHTDEYYEGEDDPYTMNENTDRNTMTATETTVEKSNPSTPIGIWRQNFYNYALDLLKKVEKILNVNNDDGIEHGDEESNDIDKTNHDHENLDPMATQMLKAFLERRISHIETGDTFAKSALVLLNSLATDNSMSTDKWMQLATGTVLYSNLSVAEVAEIIALLDVKGDEEICISPYTSMCPPQPTHMSTLDDKSILFPNSDDDSLNQISKRCVLRQENEHKCDGGSIENNKLPSSIPDGHLDYYSVLPREDDDPYTKMFLQMMLEDDNNALLPTLKELVKSLDQANVKLTELENKVKNLQDSIGRDGDEKFYGVDGEMYKMKGECFDMKAGKYTYELCIFGKAQQKEGSSTSGTSLGNWEGSKVDEDLGERVFTWSGGTRCWNGPSRSATAYVTCGAETKLFSAEEPNICQYEFEMESPIACDETYRRINGF